MNEWDGEERRSDHRPSDLQYALQAIGERLKAIEEKFSLKVDVINADVTELKTDDTIKHLDLEKRIYQKLMHEFQKLYSKLDIISNGSAGTNLQIQKLDAKVDALEKRMIELENADKNKIYRIFMQVVAKLGWVILGIVGAAILFAITNTAFWEQIGK